jgi:hypothetical protein
MLKKSIQKLLLAFIFLSMGSVAVAQNDFLVVAFGKLKVEWGNQELTKITLYEDGKQIDLFYPKNNGKFEFSLKLNHQYMFWFEKPGFVTKKVNFNTQIPRAVLDNPDFEPFPDFDFNVSLFKAYPEVDTMFFTKPVGKIKYSADINDFDYDKEYTLEIVNRMEEIENEIIRRSQEEDILSKVENANKKQNENMAALAEETRIDTLEQKKTPLKNEPVKQESLQNSKNEIKSEPQKQKVNPYSEASPKKNIASNPVFDMPKVLTKSTNQTEVAGKTITQTTVNQGNMTLVYIKVVYTWGGKFFFIQDETNQYRNISENYYNVMVAKN